MDGRGSLRTGGGGGGREARSQSFVGCGVLSCAMRHGVRNGQDHRAHGKGEKPWGAAQWALRGRTVAGSASVVIGCAIVGAAIVGAGVVGCGGAPDVSKTGGGASDASVDAARIAACYRPAQSARCETGYQVTFGGKAGLSEDKRVAGSLWCENGEAFGHFEGSKGAVTAQVAPVVWEAIWRALDQTGDCALAFDAGVMVTRKGISHPCGKKAARFELDALISAAYHTARTGPPKAPAPRRDADPEGDGLMAICAIDPDQCRVSDPVDPCPPFSGDYWAGIVAKPPPAPDASVDVQVEEEPEKDPCENRRRPPHGAVTKAIGAVLPQARQCAGSDAQPSSAELSFQPDGTVVRVVVRGWAAGKPAAACIEKALKRVRIPSFLDESYSVTVTIRPH